MIIWWNRIFIGDSMYTLSNCVSVTSTAYKIIFVIYSSIWINCYPIDIHHASYSRILIIIDKMLSQIKSPSSLATLYWMFGIFHRYAIRAAHSRNLLNQWNCPGRIGLLASRLRSHVAELLLLFQLLLKPLLLHLLFGTFHSSTATAGSTAHQQIPVRLSIFRRHYHVDYRIDTCRQIDEQISHYVQIGVLLDGLDNFRRRDGQVAGHKSAQNHEDHFQ